ncbi:terpene synthase family protein [Litoribacter populi]|uniref:terpene synthase family protein n=1 Tax=Litoribacter populi TaxID=2598460 RepID=UPI00117E1A31|nr:hypothetical protein [Litoribacter populi]
MENQIKATELKQVFDEIVVTPIEAYQMLLEFLEVETYPPNRILQQAGEVEESSRFILSGIIGLYKEGCLERLFFANQVAVDFFAYQEGRESLYTFVTLSEVKIIRLTRENESKVLEGIPEVKDLSGKLKALVMHDTKKWVALSQMHYKKTYLSLAPKLQSLQVDLTETQWSSLLGIDVRTFRRYKRELYDARNTFEYKFNTKELLNYPFESKLHDDAEEIESLTREWANKNKILPTARKRQKLSSQKLSYLSAFLYPEATIQVSKWISCFYLLLFIMDDYTDSLVKGKKAEFWREMVRQFDLIRGESPIQIHRKNKMAGILAERLSKLKTLASPIYYRHFLIVLEQFIKSNEWEAANKDRGVVPSMDQYLQNRPFFSGGNLALQLIPFTMEHEHPDINQDWSRMSGLVGYASKLIFLSNDLISYEKERGIGDFHNWIELLIIHRNMDVEKAKDALVEDHKATLAKFLQEEQVLLSSLMPVDRSLWASLKAIKYQISGTVEWSVNISKRYS